MKQPPLRRQVSAAVAQRWPDFASSHPRLAAILDEEIIVDHVTDRLQDDPAYQDAMAHAAAVGRTTDAVRKVVERFVGQFLRELLGRRRS